MSIYQKFLIRETDSFDPTSFPQLDVSLETIVTQLNGESTGPMAEMILSFVKDHRIESSFLTNYSGLASVISSKAIPIGVMEDLFESSKKNPGFTKDMEAYIRSYIVSGPSY